MIATMYWTWPLGGLTGWFDRYLIMGLAIVPAVILPWIGYIAGFKNFSVFDRLLIAYKNIIEKELLL